MKARTLFLTDLWLAIAFIPASASGFALHWAGHQNCHELWHNWAVAHILCSLLFSIVAVVHIYGHWGWYKSIVRNGVGKKSKVTIFLSVLMALVVASGIVVLIQHQGDEFYLGMKHYTLGIVLTAICVGHLAKRHKVLAKGLKKGK